MLRHVILTSPFIISASVANAQDQGDAVSVLNDLYKCAEITDDMERLACFDAQVPALKIKEDTKEIVAIDAEKARQIKRESFGFKIPSLPKLGLPKLGMDDDDPEAMKFKVKEVRKQARKYTFYMENGHIWRQVSGNLSYVPRGDLEATIKPGAMGSHRLSLSNGKTTVRGVGVKRIE